MIKEWQGCLVYLEVREVPEMTEYRDSPVIEDLRYSCVNTKLRKNITAANSKDKVIVISFSVARVILVDLVVMADLDWTV